jgi:hydroxyethylthiazole kinase-like uncharacterized protein yjeF
VADDGGHAPPRLVDIEWLRANPLPSIVGEVDKNARGRVVVLGGCAAVPGGVALTAEAALRAGAGKVRVGTIAPAAMHIGGLLPEVAILALPASADGEIDASAEMLKTHLAASDAIIVGPAMSCERHASRLTALVIEHMPARASLVLDAAALMSLADHHERLRARELPLVLTPHIGEMAAMLGCEADTIAQDRPKAAMTAARRFNAVVALKGASTVIADRTLGLYSYGSGNPGLATGGSGDVLAGIVGGLLARGASPRDALLWAVWLHGEAGRRCAESIGPLGFLARELLGLIPSAMDAAALR